MPTASLTSDSVLCLSAAMTNMDGDVELLQEIIAIFTETAATQFNTIAEQIRQGDAANVSIQAHAMKGGASNFCANKFVASARELELLARDGGLDGAGALLDRMREDFAEVTEVLEHVNWTEVAGNWGP